MFFADRQGRAAAVLALLASCATAHADYLDIDITGWKTFGTFGNAGNSASFARIAAGATVTGFSYSDLSITTSNGSHLTEFTLSLNNADLTAWLEWRPSTVNAAGSFGPASGGWGGPSGLAGYSYGPGGAFTTADGWVYLTVYDFVDDAIGVAQPELQLDATVGAGLVRIFYTLSPVPEPATVPLLGGGLLMLLGVSARRRACAAK